MGQHIFDLLRAALVHYGYWAVAGALLLENAGLPVPGETVLLMASFLAYTERDLQLGWIILVGTVAATLGDNLGFAIGHYGGPPLLERYRGFRSGTAVARGEKLFSRYGAATILFGSFTEMTAKAKTPVSWTTVLRTASSSEGRCPLPVLR